MTTCQICKKRKIETKEAEKSFSNIDSKDEIFLIYCHPRRYVKGNKDTNYHFLGDIFDQIADKEKTTKFQTIDNIIYSKSILRNTADYKEDGFSDQFIDSNKGKFKVVYLPDCDGEWTDLINEWIKFQEKIEINKSSGKDFEELLKQQQKKLTELLGLIKKLKTLVKPGGIIFFGKFVKKELSSAVQEADSTLVNFTEIINNYSPQWLRGKLGTTLAFRNGE